MIGIGLLGYLESQLDSRPKAFLQFHFRAYLGLILRPQSWYRGACFADLFH